MPFRCGGPSSCGKVLGGEFGGPRGREIAPRGRHGAGMTLLSVKGTRTLGPPSRALRYLPVTALALDLVVMLDVFVLAILGRNRLDVFDRQGDVSSTLQVAGPLVLLGWLVVIAWFGGYRDDVF